MDIEENKDARTWGMLCHLSALLAIIGIPLGNVIGPLIVWLLKKNDFPFVDIQGKLSINFQISMTIYAIIAALLIFVLVGLPLLIALAIADIVLIIIASIKASDGISYQYPLSINFLK